MAIRSFEAKLGKMRKPQRFVTYPRKSATEPIVIQSDKAIGKFDPKTGEGVMNFRGQYFLHLSAALGAERFTLPADVLKLAIDVGAVNGDGIVNLFGPNPGEAPIDPGSADDVAGLVAEQRRQRQEREEREG